MESYSGIFLNGDKLTDKRVAGMDFRGMSYLGFYLRTAKALNDEIQKVVPNAAFNVYTDNIDAILSLADSKGKYITDQRIVDATQKALELTGFRSVTTKGCFRLADLSGVLTARVDGEAVAQDQNVKDKLISNIKEQFAGNVAKCLFQANNNSVEAKIMQDVFTKNNEH